MTSEADFAEHYRNNYRRVLADTLAQTRGGGKSAAISKRI